MKRFIFSSLGVISLIALIGPVALAAQVSPSEQEADLNNDGQVTETELKFYNRDERGA